MIKKYLLILISCVLLIGATNRSSNLIGRILEKEEGMVLVNGGPFYWDNPIKIVP